MLERRRAARAVVAVQQALRRARAAQRLRRGELRVRARRRALRVQRPVELLLDAGYVHYFYFEQHFLYFIIVLPGNTPLPPRRRCRLHLHPPLTSHCQCYNNITLS